MSILTYKCPHQDCLTDHIGLVVVATNVINNDYAGVHLVCPKCHMPSCALVTRDFGNHIRMSIGDASQRGGDILDVGWKVVEFWPDPPRPNIPEFIHPDVARIYLQAERNFPVDGNEEVAGMAYRKALDIGLKKIDPSLTGMLGPRIKKLAEAGKLAPDITVWADNIIKVIGNDAAHEEDPISRPDLIVLRNFTEMVLRYLFTLPNMVKKRRGERLDWEPEPT